MESLLTPIHTKSKLEVKEDILPVNIQSQHKNKDVIPISSPEDALHALRSKPEIELLTRVLHWLNPSSDRTGPFNVRKPGSKAAQIIHVLVNDIVPNYWQLLTNTGASGHTNQKHYLILCLRSVAGIGAIFSRLRILLNLSKDAPNQANVLATGSFQPVDDLLSLLEEVINGDDFFASIWKSIDATVDQSSQRFLQWKELLSLVASGKLLAIVGEASHASDDKGASIKNGIWIEKGNLYATWLGRNVRCMNRNVLQNDKEGRKAMSQLFSKALNLGYRGKYQVIKATFQDLIDGDSDLLGNYQALVRTLLAHEQKSLLNTLIGVLSKEKLCFTSANAKMKLEEETRALRGVAALIAALVEGNSTLQASLVDWLISVSADATAQSHTSHRAVIVVVAKDNGESFGTTPMLKLNKEFTVQAMQAFQKCLGLFGDKLYIKHTPILHQEVTTQILLMLAGYCFRANRTGVANLAASSVYLNAISNRLAASSPRARFLGMVVGTAISELVDPKDKRMKFGAEDLDGPDGSWYRGLPTIKDAIGSIDDLKPIRRSPSKPTANAAKAVDSNPTSRKIVGPAKSASKIISIEEIDDGSDTEDEDLPLYAKPDSDHSDEDEDPTLVQRDRPTAPVYVRDLIAGLRDTENFDRHRLALTHAASLIRRKAAFGTEVSDNIEELATLLVGLSDKWEIEDFQKLRLQGMIAVLTVSPLKMGQWFSRTFYNGDYSMSQRASVLTTLGMGARELAGLGQEDAALTGALKANETTFPSKRLPDKLHKIYALEAGPLDALSTELEKSIITPMAATAADELTGPSALKVRTFSSRLAVEKKRQRPIPNALAKIVSEGFFFPLTGLFRIHIQSHGSTTTHTSPFLLSHLLKTLSLILHASGSSTLSLPQMTSEFWDLLLSLRPRASDPSVLEALLFAFLTLLDINENDQRRVAEEQARELLETQGWVEGLLERVGGGSEEGDRVRMLAAGVLVRTREVVERYQRVLMGDLVDYM